MAWENTPSDDTCQANSGSESSTTEYRRTENVQSGPVDQLDGEGQHHSETNDISTSDRPNDRAAAAALVQLHDPEQTMFQSGDEVGLNAGNFAEFERRDLIKLPYSRSYEGASASTFHPAVQQRSLPNPSYNVSNHPSTIPYTLPTEMCMQNTVSSLSKAVLSIQQQQTAMQQNQSSITGALRDMTSMLREAINGSLAQPTGSFHSERSNIVSAASQEQNSHVQHATEQHSCINNDVQTDRSYSVQQYREGEEYNNAPPSSQRERNAEVQYPIPFQNADRSQGTSAMQVDSSTARPGRFPSQSQVDRNGSIPVSAQNISVLQYPYPPQSYTYGSLVAPSMQTDNSWKPSLPNQTQTNRHGALPPQAQTPSALQCPYPVQDREGRFHQEWPTPLAPRYRENGYHRSVYENRSYSTPLPEAKLPPFTGKEEWKTWFNRFEAVARRRNWDEETKLDNFLPRLQGTAGDFVFSQLPQHTLSNYNNLVKELNNRFRVVETEKTFAAKFSQRCQRQGETAEEYAADLKRLYAKAYKSRDEKTRQEDLVRRFLDGLRDHEARFEIEFHKEPSNIEEAVYHAVNFVQTKRRSSTEAYTDRKFKKSIRRTSPDSEDESDGSEFIERGGEYEQVMRVPCREEGKHLKKPQRGERKTEAIASNPVPQPESLKVLSETKELIQALANQISELKKTAERAPDKQPATQPVSGGGILCYGCRQRGHIVKDCPLRSRQQIQRTKTVSRENDQRQNKPTDNHLN